MRIVTLCLPFFAVCAILTVPALRLVSAYEVATRSLAPLPEVVAIRQEVARRERERIQLAREAQYRVARRISQLSSHRAKCTHTY